MTHVDDLTAEQVELVRQLKENVKDFRAHACLRAFLNEHCYVRYMRARKWDLAKATKMLVATLEWRLSYKPHELTWRDVEGEAGSGKQVILPCVDRGGRPVWLMRPRNENSKNPETQIKFLVYNLEVASRLCDGRGGGGESTAAAAAAAAAAPAAAASGGKLTLLVDFEGYSLSCAPSMSTSLACLNILQNHYPERLGRAVCYHAPMLFSMSWKAIRPFVDPVTQQKVVFVEASRSGKDVAHMAELFDLAQMESCMGGQMEGTYFQAEAYGSRMAAEHDAPVAAELAALQQSEEMAAAGEAAGGAAGGKDVAPVGIATEVEAVAA